MIAATPPMGWNSWDCFGGSVTEDEVLANAKYMAQHLLPHGWQYVVVDIQWYEPDAGSHDYRPVATPCLDEYGRQLPAPNRFPSAADGAGFAPLAQQVHDLGLKFGVHMMRGIPRAAVEARLPLLDAGGATAADIADRDNTCPWNPDNYGINHDHPSAQAFYDSQLALFAEWGVDLVKLDDVLYPPIQRAEIASYAHAIERSGREMVLSLSPGKQLSLAQHEFVAEHSQMWRISDDLWDDWASVAEMFQRTARWAPHQRPGAWADADMLPLGHLGIRAHVGGDRLSRLTPDEQRSLVTLWTMARSPMMFGGHLPDTPDHTLELLTNDRVLAVLQGSSENREIIRDHELVVWAATLDQTPVRAVFWLGDQPTTLRLHLDDLGVQATGNPAHDLWQGSDLTLDQGWIELDLPAHGCRMIALG